MSIVIINEQIMEIETPVSLQKIVQTCKPDADVFIVDGGMVGLDYTVKGRAKIALIRRGELPSEEELYFMITARNSPELTNVLNSTKIGIAGLGGLGSAVAVAFARLGVRELTGVDFDVVEPSNINRQYYFLDQIGMKKTDALDDTLKRINPFSKYELIHEKITEENAGKLFIECDVIIEAFDNPYAKSLLFDAWGQHYAGSAYYIGASGVAGYNDDNPITVKKIGKNAYIVGDLSTEAQPGMGLTASRVGIAAHMQANLAVNLLVNKFAK